jgi:hypothetical protein
MLLPALSAASVTLACLALTVTVLTAGTPSTAHAVGQPIPPFDVNAPVVSSSQCAVCHANLNASIKPGLIFSHGSHLLLSCDACHWQPPHQQGNTLGPTMESCFNCHGLQHGPRGKLARGDCKACHTPSFNLRPTTHTKDWAAKPHADRAKAGSNSCLMCHDAKTYCDDCHIKKGLNLPPTTPTSYQPLLPAKPRKPPIRVFPTGQVTIGQCVNCHPDLDAFTRGRVIFAHADHLQRQYSCRSCHPAFAHSPDLTTRPDMPTCYQCHALVHATSGTVATGKCDACHPKGFELMPSDHTAEFRKSTHKDAANENPAQCAMCHEPKFCASCHQGKPAKPGGPSRAKVIPADHRKARFLKAHGGTYLLQKGACGSCHDSASCEKCHKTPMPHPADWTSTHGQYNLNTDDCNVCHTDRQKCQECHHNPLKGAQLIKRNCVKCHAEMNAADPTTIKNKGLAEHAVHFNVYKSKGKPYRCEECHIGFGLSKHIGKPVDLTQGHDLQLCYTCHGALDYRNVAIAPYPGNSLCLRCHKTLNI